MLIIGSNEGGLRAVSHNSQGIVKGPWKDMYWTNKLCSIKRLFLLLLLKIVLASSPDSLLISLDIECHCPP